MSEQKKKTSHTLDHYRLLAPLYDYLARAVFGQAIDQAQRIHLLKHRERLIHMDRVFWLGGGTGRIINEVIDACPQATIYYIEPSQAMRQRAMSRIGEDRKDRVIWIEHTHRWLYHHAPSLNRDTKREVILTFFVLDVLVEDVYRELLDWMKQRGSLVLFSDFVPQPRLIGRVFIAFMYRCFWLTTRIEQRKILDHAVLFDSMGWSILEGETVQSFARGLIQAIPFIPSRGDVVQTNKENSLASTDHSDGHG